jgi:Ca-activated chloride channel homolog
MIAHYLPIILGLAAISSHPAQSGLASHLDRGCAQSNTQTKSPSSSITPGAPSTPGAPGPALAPSQRPEERATDGPTVKLITDVVTVSVTVTDSNDSLVTGLDRQDFEVFEDKVKQKIEYFSDEDVPISVGIIFDVSGSMGMKIDRAREAFKAFVQSSHDDDDFFLIGFNRRANLMAEFADGATLLNKLTLVSPQGGTALYDAAYLGVEKVKQGRHNKKAIILISDGQDNASRYTYRELRKLLKETDVQVYCIGIVETREEALTPLDTRGRTILEEFSYITGGKTFFPNSEAELEDVTARIASELRRQYSIGYVPSAGGRDGKWRKIIIRANSPRSQSKLYVRAKEGYYALPR